MAAAETWTIQRILDWTRGWFEDKGIDSARLDAELLLAEVLAVERIYLYTHFDKPLSDDERARYRALVKRRAAREPVAYIVGRREFFSRDFEVGPDVLVPRPETEHIVEAVIAWAGERTGLRLLDIGTGSGNIAISLACELPTAAVVATDISEAALAVARRNAERHGVTDRVEFAAGDLFGAVAGHEPFDAVASNPPYVEQTVRDSLMPEVRDFEPGGALFAGDDGMDALTRLCTDAHGWLAPGGIFVCEFDSAQRNRVVELLRAHGSWSDIRDLLDLQGLNRAVIAKREA